MRKTTTIKDLANKIKEIISSGETTIFYITDAPLRVYEGKRREESEIIDVPEGNKYDNIFEELNKNLFNSKKPVFWDCKEGTYTGTMIIDSTVIVKFEYCSLEGQSWLYQKYKIF